MHVRRTPNNSRSVRSALLVVTSHTQLGDTGKKTGFWFEELATPFWAFYDAGYEVTIASIKGGQAQADPLSIEGEALTPSVERFLSSAYAMQQLENTPAIDEIDTRGFTTLFLSGGHGTLWDFRQSRGLARVVSEFYADDKLIGTVCHGPTGLLSARKPDNTPLVQGLKITSFTDSEETLTPPEYIEALPYHLEDALVEQGAIFEKGRAGDKFVVCERGLISGQNPGSTALVVSTVLDALAKPAVWIDTDLSAGKASESGTPCDVDDAYAILSLFNASDLKVKGISAVFGNTDLDSAYERASEIADRFGPTALPVVKGAAAAMDINAITETDATRALAKQLRKEPTTIVAIGPATNIASLVLLYPELVPRINQVILVAGRSSEDLNFIVGPNQEVPFRDLNFDLDPDAFRILLEKSVPLVFTPFELARKVLLTQADLDTLGASGRAGKYLQTNSQPWLDHWEKAFGARGFNPFDALAAGFAKNPNLFKWRKVPVEIRIAADDTQSGRFGLSSHYKPYLVASEQCVSQHSVLFCYDVAENFSELLIGGITQPNDPGKFISAVSHLNIVVDDIDKATAFYRRTLGFEQAWDDEGKIMDYPGLTLTSFAKDAGFLDGKVDVDIRFLHHPTVGLYLELMRYRYPEGSSEITLKNTNDLGGIRHTALEVDDVMEAFNYLKDQPGVEILKYPADHGDREEADNPPMMLNPFPVSFFYWRDPYGVQWEMECGRKRGYLRGI